MLKEIKELESELNDKDMLIIDLLWLLIDKGIDPIKEGYEDLIKEHDIQYNNKDKLSLYYYNYYN